MNDTFQKAAETFESGLFCAESVLKVIAEEEGIYSEFIPGIATGLCSGMSRTCNTCGALTGGILALGLVYGRNKPDESVEKNYMAVQELMSRFENEFGTLNCRELIDIDLGAEDGPQTFQENECHIKCREYTGKAAEITRDIIDSNSKP